MKNSARKNADRDSFTLPIQGEMTIYQAAELKPVLLESLHRSPQLEIDLSAVSQIDAAGVQLLLMIKKAAHEQQRKVHLTRHSPAVVEALDLIDLAGYFGDPLVMSQESSPRSTK